MKILVLFSALCITVYTIAVCIKCNGIPYSISETFYKLEHKWWFLVTMWLTAGLLMPAILESTPGCYQFTAFLACIGMMFVGVAPNFREGLDSPVHITGAILCILFSQVWVLLTCPWMMLVWAVYLAYTVLAMKKYWKGNFISAFLLTKPMFYVEVIALFSTYVTLLT
ncbi:glycosyl transferase [Bacteroides sp. AN502]|nr:glycosyl transferase [Caecibacteroides pullorum]MDC6279755.1 glycosyl transferase [Caecibacteroides pullorum]